MCLAAPQLLEVVEAEAGEAVVEAEAGEAGCAHVSAHGASESSIWGNCATATSSDLRPGEKNNDSSISHHTVSMVFFAHFIIA